MASRYTDIPLYQGKVNKTQLLKRIIDDEMDGEGRVDTNLVLSIARNALLHYPRKQRNGVVLTLDDVHRVSSEIRGKRMEEDNHQTRPSSMPVPSNITAPTEKWEAVEEAPFVFTADQLCAAVKLISACEGNRWKAGSAVALVDLIRAKEVSREGLARPATEPGRA